MKFVIIAVVVGGCYLAKKVGCFCWGLLRGIKL